MINVDEIWKSMQDESKIGTNIKKLKSINSLWESEVRIRKTSFKGSNKNEYATNYGTRESKSCAYNTISVAAVDSDDDSDCDLYELSESKRTANINLIFQLRRMIRDPIERLQALDILHDNLLKLLQSSSAQPEKISKLISVNKKNENDIESTILTVGEGDGDERHGIVREGQLILDTLGRDLFSCLNENSEKVRIGATQSISELCLLGLDLSMTLAYLLPTIFSKFQFAKHDPEMNIFVHDCEYHSFYKRGGAGHRQDKLQVRFQSLESCEEVRLGICAILSSVFKSCFRLQAIQLLEPYFVDIILTLHACISADNCIDIKIASGSLLCDILRIQIWEEGLKHFATALARSAMSLLRHKQSKVRLLAIELFEASVSVPNRQKMKGAGSEAIRDLVGSRDENVLPIAAFYKAEYNLQVNILAELSNDGNIRVRRRCCIMLSNFLRNLPDRYDHQQRLIPYILSFHQDTDYEVREIAFRCITSCGNEYESTHVDEIIERVQYGVDGDTRSNHTDPLPYPFMTRPKLGARLFVRNNSKTFLEALLNELRNWIPATRVQSLKLLCILIVYFEEHLTMEIQKIITAIIKALLKIQADEDKKNLVQFEVDLKNILILIGRFVDPSVYSKVVLNRIVASLSFDEFMSCNTFKAYMIALRSMVLGSLPRRVLPCLPSIVTCLTDEGVLENFSTTARHECLISLIVITNRVKGTSFRGTETDIFQESGRLCDISAAIETSLKSIKSYLSNLGKDEPPELHDAARDLVDNLEIFG